MNRLGLAGALEQAGRLLHWKAAMEAGRMETPERIRCALEELGPTFIKLGQVLATRVDLFPPDWIAEFERLQDAVPAVPFEELRPQLEEDLGVPLEQVFLKVRTEPLAAGSIAQVHRAWTPRGEAVVLKVRRPGIRKVVEADLRLLARLAEMAERRIPELARYRPREMMRQFAASLRRELDFVTEAHQQELIRQNFADDLAIVIPKIYWEWTCERLNVQEYVQGIPGKDLEAVEKAGLDRKVLARRGAQAVLKMILVDGLFHADPHPGNLFYLPGNRLAFIDFGMVGRLSENRRAEMVRLLYGLVARRADQVVEAMLHWSGDDLPDEEGLLLEVELFLDRYHGLPLQQLNMTAMILDFTAILREHGLILPPDLTLLFKAFITLDGFGRQLDPDFDIVGESLPILERVMAERYAPGRLLKQGWTTLADLAEVLGGLPRDLRRLLRLTRRGALQLHVDVTRLDHFGHQIDRAASRLTIGLITAALIVGTAIATTSTEGGPLGTSLFAVIGFIAAVLGGLWVLVSVWRSRRE